MALAALARDPLTIDILVEIAAHQGLSDIGF
jgi:hypothetical protein